MALHITLTPGRIAGWMMLGFLGAVGVHSLVPYGHTSDLLLASIILGSIVPVAVTRIRALIALLLIVASVAFGWWRFERAPVPKLQRIGSHQLIMKAKDDSFLSRWRAGLSHRVASVLPLEDATLVTGVLYGDQALTTEQKARFRSAGLMHLVAVSGSNVTVVVQVMVLFAMRLKFKRRTMFWAVSAALLFFTLFVGMSASVVRAAFMAWLMLLAYEVGRPALSSRLLLVAATVLVMVHPWQLFFDAGFALSFLAMWGLFTLVPIFERWLKWIPNWFETRTTISMTLAATIATAPYQAWAFGQLSLAGLFTNVLALPLIPFVMGWGAATAAWGDMRGHEVVSIPTLGLVRVIDAIASLADKTPWIQFEMKGVSLTVLIACYVVLVYFVRQCGGKTDLSTQKEGC